MRKLLLFLSSTTNVNFSLLIISCKNGESFQAIEDSAFLSQNDDEKIMQQFINEVKDIDFKLSEYDLPIKIQTIVLNKLNAFIRKNKKYQNISVKIEKISKINEKHYIISYLPLLQAKQHIKFASTLTVTIIESEKDQLQEQQPIETDENEEILNSSKSIVSNEESNIVKDVSITKTDKTSLIGESKTMQSFSLEYQAKFTALQQELRIKTFEYDFAQTTYSDFIATILVPWFDQRLTNLNYNLDVLSYVMVDEIMGNTISSFILDITFNDEANTKQQLLIKVNCKEKATQEAHDILGYVWKQLTILQRQNFQFDNLPSLPNYSDIIGHFETKLKNESVDYQNFTFIFKGISESKNKTTLLQEGNNKIDFTIAINNKSFFYLWVNYVF